MANRITQIPIETSIQPSDGKIRITQIPVETSIQPSDGKIRVTQVYVETSIQPPDGKIRVTQVYVETSIPPVFAPVLAIQPRISITFAKVPVQNTVVVYDMLAMMLMAPSLASTYCFHSTELDGVTPANHLYTQLNSDHFYWTKGDGGYPWDINLYDANFIYLSTTELTYSSATEGKRFESLNPSIGYKGVPFAKRFMQSGESVLSSDTRLAIYTACGSATYTNIGNARCTLVGPFIETIAGAGQNIPSNLTTMHIQYEWSLDSSYNYQSGSTRETFTFAPPYGLVHWQTQAWDTGTGSFDAPTNATNYNILTAVTVVVDDPCPFAV